jgi:hypothetical protein
MVWHWLVWTTVVWSSIFGFAAAQVIGYLMARREYAAYRRWGVSRAETHELGACSAQVSDAPSRPGQ